MMNVMKDAQMIKYDKLAASKIVRSIMQAHGKTRIFNNLYDTGTRSVKCYGQRSKSQAMIDDIARTLTGLQVHYIVKATDGVEFRNAPAIIIKLV